MDPLSNKFVMPIDSYDVTLLPPDKRDPNSPDFPLAISKQLTEELSAFGAKARIIVDPEFIEIEWDPTSRIDIVGAAVKLLQSGNYRSGVPLLRNILANDTDNTVVLFNLGMALSDLGELGDAITYLRRLVKLEQDNPNAWIALGIAENRNGDAEQSVVSLRKSVELVPNDPLAYRNLGGTLLKLGQFDEARLTLEKASELNPKDQGIWFGLRSHPTGPMSTSSRNIYVPRSGGVIWLSVSQSDQPPPTLYGISSEVSVSSCMSVMSPSFIELSRKKLQTRYPGSKKHFIGRGGKPIARVGGGFPGRIVRLLPSISRLFSN